MVYTYYQIGRMIVEKEQNGSNRAEYGKYILKELSNHLTKQFGKGFTFVGRQVRFTFDEEHCRVDLVFYNRLLRCFVLFDLKIGELKHQDIGQMQMNVNYYDIKVKLNVEMTLPEVNNQIFASQYQTVLLSKEELKELLEEKD